MIITYKYRLKSKNSKFLDKLSKEVNFIWNYCNEISLRRFKESRTHVSAYDLQKLLTGSSKSGLKLNSASTQMVAQQLCRSKIQFRKVKLRWRGRKSLGFIPVRQDTIKMSDDRFKFNGKEFRIWKHRDYIGVIRSSTISQDSKGYWYLNLVCKQDAVVNKDKTTIGIDLGLKTVATDSQGEEYKTDNLTRKYAKKLATAQRAKNKKQVTNIHRKIKNTRKDNNHKISKEIVSKANIVYVGDVSSSKLIKTNMRKSVYDRSWFQLKSMIHYKAVRAGGYMKEINESFTTVTCSACGKRTGPSGLSNLSKREFTCSNCNTFHNRDVNSAINIEILGIGHDTL